MENKEIFELLRSGDKEVIKNVYKENAKDIYNFSKSIIGDHDLSMEVTKKAFVKLFSGIQNGDEPVNIRLAALKVAYDEACKVALPSSENIDSPYDRNEREKPEEPSAAAEAAEPEEPAVKERVWVEIEQEPAEEREKAFDVYVAAPAAAVFEEKAPAEELVPTGEGYSFVMEEKKADSNSAKVIDISVQDDSETEKKPEEDDEPVEEKTTKKKKSATKVLIIVNIILVLILIWLVYGLLESLGVLPDNLCFDLGYTWFNEMIYPVF